MQNNLSSSLAKYSAFCLSRSNGEWNKGAGKCVFISFWSVPQSVQKHGSLTGPVRNYC